MNNWKEISNLLSKQIKDTYANQITLVLAEAISKNQDIKPIVNDIFSRYSSDLNCDPPILGDGKYPSDLMIITDCVRESDIYTRIPLSGLHTLATSSCGTCSKLKSCHSEYISGIESTITECIPDTDSSLMDTSNIGSLETKGQMIDNVLDSLHMNRDSWLKLREKKIDPKPSIFVTSVIKHPTTHPVQSLNKAIPWLLLEAYLVNPKATIFITEGLNTPVIEKLSLEGLQKSVTRYKKGGATSWFNIIPPFGLTMLVPDETIVPGITISPSLLTKYIKHAINYIERETFPPQEDNPIF